MKYLTAAMIGLALTGSANAAVFMSSPTTSPFPEQQYQPPPFPGNPIPQPQYYEPQRRGDGLVICQTVDRGVFYCSR